MKEDVFVMDGHHTPSNLHAIKTKSGYIFAQSSFDYVLAVCNFGCYAKNFRSIAQEFITKLSAMDVLTDQGIKVYLHFPWADKNWVQLMRSGDRFRYFRTADPAEIQKIIDTLGDD